MTATLTTFETLTLAEIRRAGRAGVQVAMLVAPGCVDALQAAGLVTVRKGTRTTVTRAFAVEV
jgi:hypothetical protein